MSSWFGGGKAETPVVPEAPPPPAIDQTVAAKERDAAGEEERRKRLNAGRSMTNPTGGLGDLSNNSAAAKKLLGV